MLADMFLIFWFVFIAWAIPLVLITIILKGIGQAVEQKLNNLKGGKKDASQSKKD